MKKIFKLKEKVNVKEYTIEYSNFCLFIKKDGNLIKCIERRKDYNEFDYTKDIDKFIKIILK